jgi:hypothetical protein
MYFFIASQDVLFCCVVFLAGLESMECLLHHVVYGARLETSVIFRQSVVAFLHSIIWFYGRVNLHFAKRFWRCCCRFWILANSINKSWLCVCISVISSHLIISFLSADTNSAKASRHQLKEAIDSALFDMNVPVVCALNHILVGTKYYLCLTFNPS